VAIDPSLIRIPRIADMALYLTELYDVSFLEGAPTFYEFLEEVRGIPRDHFSPLAWELISLQNEMVAYNMLVRSVAEAAQYKAQSQRQSAEKTQTLAGLGLDDLLATRNLLAGDLDGIDTLIAAAAQAQADAHTPTS